ncbi:protein kinase domain-containing protein [Brevibacillus sp. B_LB10_24]|uniref:protein kinase domain-containing protein n=1 Tax=Brevibacillus sp. B_LB10_24 TaxID=3380645 RepID=UPI0038BD24EE
MFTIPGYRFQELILEEPHMFVCRAFSEQNSSYVTMKIVKDGPRSIIENAKLMHEYEIAGNLHIRGVLKPYSLMRQGNVLVLTYEWVNGLTLQHYFQTCAVPLPLFLQLAIKTCKILDNLHQQQIIHMNIRPETLILSPSSQRIYITGFGHAITTARQDQTRRSIPMMEGSPPYMSPERTRRMSWGIDGRSDLYSLGITFYELLTGILPFYGKDPVEWAHAHLAKQPLPFPDGVSIPPIVGAIIYKLLRKNPSERYQSVRGLIADLNRCLAGWEKNGTWDHFELGMHDAANAELFAYPGQTDSGDRGILAANSDPNEPKAVDSPGVEYSQLIDLAAVMKASQAFSQEMDLDALLQKLMTIILENAGGQKAFLLSVRDGQMYVEAVAKAGERVNSPGESAPLSKYGDQLCQAIVQFVAKTSEEFILNDAACPAWCLQDPYIVQMQPKSILGLPIPIQGTLAGVLYIENNLIQSAFSQDRIHILQMLASQIMYVQKMQRSFAKQAKQEQTKKQLLSEINHPLTEREREVLLLLAEGLSNSEVAEALFLATETVKIHLKKIFYKLQVNNRTKAVAKARLLGLLQDD